VGLQDLYIGVARCLPGKCVITLSGSSQAQGEGRGLHTTPGYLHTNTTQSINNLPHSTIHPSLDKMLAASLGCKNCALKPKSGQKQDVRQLRSAGQKCPHKRLSLRSSHKRVSICVECADRLSENLAVILYEDRKGRNEPRQSPVATS
jgi:hypothetical protein